MDPYKDPANAIIIQAVNDDRLHDGEQALIVIERFFRSGWFGFLTNTDSEMLITKLKKEKKQYGY